jgi:hypothetical protein
VKESAVVNVVEETFDVEGEGGGGEVRIARNFHVM